MVVDVRGFTRLGESVDHAGPAGTERLSDMVDAVVAPIVERVHAHGGEVGRFVGDSVVALFPDGGAALDCAAELPSPPDLALLDRARDGAGGALIVSGEPGIGTSRLLAALAARRPSWPRTASRPRPASTAGPARSCWAAAWTRAATSTRATSACSPSYPTAAGNGWTVYVASTGANIDVTAADVVAVCAKAA
jgi:hypothetical protein